jgi:hypothetical protein
MQSSPFAKPLERIPSFGNSSTAQSSPYFRPMERIPTFGNSSTAQSFPYFRPMPKFGEPGFVYNSGFCVYGFTGDIGPLFNQMNLAYIEKFPEKILKKSEKKQNKIKSGKILRDKWEFGLNPKWNDDEKKKVKMFDRFHGDLIKHIISHTKYQASE